MWYTVVISRFIQQVLKEKFICVWTFQVVITQIAFCNNNYSSSDYSLLLKSMCAFEEFDINLQPFVLLLGSFYKFTALRVLECRPVGRADELGGGGGCRGEVVASPCYLEHLKNTISANYWGQWLPWHQPPIHTPPTDLECDSLPP